MEIQSLTARLNRAGLLKGEVLVADGLTADRLVQDSREVGPRSLFVAVRGGSADGHLFIDKAVYNGAIAVVCEAVPGNAEERFPGTAFIEVTDSRAALAEAASLFFRDPSLELRVVGVTGTNGKTTTSFLVHHLLNAVGWRCGLIGTIQVDVGHGTRTSTMTTPDAITVQRVMREMRDNGCEACAMEVSSHAIDQGRVHSVAFDTAVFTNLTAEHLDYHHTLEAYLQAKKKLFDGLDVGSTALYNVDDPAGPRMVTDTAASPISYGFGSTAAVRAEVIENSISGLRLRLDGLEGQFRLVGLFNAYNLTAAYGVGLSLGLREKTVFEALQTAPPVPGRFEQIRVSRDRTVVVDYAHTPDALQNVLQTLQALRQPGSRIWCVFGCGGDRDRTKRPVMGQIAERYADEVIVTSDNPRTEDPEAILSEIRTGMERPDRARWIVDRRAAIATAAEESAAGDIILIAGKGHETYQLIGTEKLDFDDREEARNAFAE